MQDQRTGYNPISVSTGYDSIVVMLAPTADGAGAGCTRRATHAAWQPPAVRPRGQQEVDRHLLLNPART